MDGRAESMGCVERTEGCLYGMSLEAVDSVVEDRV